MTDTTQPAPDDKAQAEGDPETVDAALEQAERQEPQEPQEPQEQ